MMMMVIGVGELMIVEGDKVGSRGNGGLAGV